MTKRGEVTLAEDAYAVCERRDDGTVVRVGPRALTASLAQEAYLEAVREDVGAPPRMSRIALEALDRARQRMQAQEQRRIQFETCGDPNCKHCAPSWAKLA